MNTDSNLHSDLDVMGRDEGNRTVGGGDKIRLYSKCSSPAIVTNYGTIPNGIPVRT
jgi:hypothetical protein